MKKIILSSIVIIIVLISCGKKETLYSCDPSINAWALKNSESFHGISREQLATLAPALQKAVYRTLTAEEKYELWLEKLTLVKNTNAGEGVKSEIELLLDQLQAAWYVRDADESLNSDDSAFLANWEYGILSGMKMDSTSYIINFCMLMTEDEIDKMLYNPDELDHSWIVDFDLPDISTRLKAPPGSPDCSCRYNIFCSIFGDAECEAGGCNAVHDCGLLGTSECKGLCPEEKPLPS